MNSINKQILALCFLLGSLSLTGCLSQATTDASAVSANSTLTLSASETSVGYGVTVDLMAGGGTKPYLYYIQTGDGYIDSGTGQYTSGNSNETAVVGVKDKEGTIMTLSISVSDVSTGDAGTGTVDSSTISFSFAKSVIMTGETVSMNAAGGTPPYSYALTTGADGGTISGTSFTAGTVAENVTVQVSDANGQSASATVEIDSNAAISGTATIKVSSYAGFTFDNYDNSSLDGGNVPQLVFWGTGATYTNNNQIAAEVPACLTGTNVDVQSPCVAKIPLTNLKSGSTNLNAYVGSVTIAGRSGGTAAFQFCVRSTEPGRAYLNWSTKVNLKYATILYNLPTRLLLSGRSIRGAFSMVDAPDGAGSATVSLSGAHYTATTTCGTSFTTDQYVESSAN